jgi:hypothetical protein
MLKKIALLILVLCLMKTGKAQGTTAEKDQLSAVPNDYELSANQYADWKNVMNVWNAGEYEKIKFEYKVNMSCKTCNAFYIDVLIKVNASGKMEYYKFIDGKKCGRALTKAEELRMMKFFFKCDIPASLWNTTFKTRLGSTLKC